MHAPMCRVLALFLVVWAALGCDDGAALVAVEGRLAVADRLEFGDVQIGLRSSAVLEIENVGDAVLRVTDIRSGEAFVTNTYAFSLDERSFIVSPGEVRALTVQLQPFAVGPARSSLIIATDGVDASGQREPTTVALEGEGVRSGLEVVPDPVDFGAVLAGASRTVTVRVFNRLSSAVPLFTELDSSGVPTIVNEDGRGRFELLEPEPDAQGRLTQVDAPLAPQQALDVRLRYVPDPSDLDRDDQAQWTVGNCEATLCGNTVTLVGRGTNAAVRCAPASIDFGRVTPDATATATVTCENMVNEPVTLTGWQLSVETPPVFSVAPFEGDPRVLEPGERVDVGVRFAPTIAELGTNLEGGLLVRGRNPIAGRDLIPAVVSLAGTAGGPNISVLPHRLGFGPVAIETIKERRLLIVNSGFDDLTVSDVSVDGAAFSVDRARFVIPPGREELVTVTYRPTAERRDEGVVQIVSNDADEPRIEVPVQGDGRVLPPCQYTVSPTEIRFGIVEILRSTEQGVRIQNVGAEECLVTGLRIEPRSAPYFRIDSVDPDDGQAILPPGDSLTAVISYTPQRDGRHDGELGFYVSSPSAPNPSVNLSGFGAESALLVSPNAIDFGQVDVGCATREQRVTIYNTSAVTTSIDRIERPAGVSAEFVLDQLPTGLPGRSIAPGQSLEFVVRYEAADLGPDTGVVHIFETGKSEPYVVSLLGAGARNATNEDRFVQLETPEVDILFVIDNSCSMTEEQASLTANFRSFIQFAETQALDYQIAVISTDMSTCPWPVAPDRPSRLPQGRCGYFADGSPFERDPSWRLIRPGTEPDPETAFEVVATQGTNGSGIELGLEAAYRAMTAPLITGWNAGFLRPSASLALIFVSDEDDQSNNSVDFYVNFFLAIKGFRNTNLLSASAIVGDRDDQCGEVSDPGLRYLDVAVRTGGVIERICTPDWARSLQNLGQTVFGFKRQFFLNNQPAAGSVEVSIDGVTVPAQRDGRAIWTYDPGSNSIEFSALSTPEPGSEIVVTYQAECL